MSLSPNKPTSLPLQGTTTNIKKKKSFQFKPFNKMRKLMKLPNKANDDNSPTAPHQPSTSPTTPATTPTDHPSKVTHRPVGGSTHDILYTTNVSNKQNSELGRKISVSMDDVSFSIETDNKNNKQKNAKNITENNSNNNRNINNNNNNNDNNTRKHSKARTQSTSSKGRSGDDDDDDDYDKASDDGLPLSPLSYNEKAPSSTSFDSSHGRLSEDSCLNILDDSSKTSNKNANDALDLDNMFDGVKKLDITVAKQRRNIRPTGRRAFTVCKSITEQNVLSEFTSEEVSFSIHNENIAKPSPHNKKPTNNLIKTHKRTLSNKDYTEDKQPEKMADFKPLNNAMTSPNDAKKVNERSKVDMVRAKKGYGVDLKELQAKRKTIALLNADKVESKDFKKKLSAQMNNEEIENVFEKKIEALKKTETDAKAKPPTIAAKPSKFIKPSVPVPTFKLKDNETIKSNITFNNINNKNNDKKNNNNKESIYSNNDKNNKNESNHIDIKNNIKMSSGNDINEKVDKKVVQENNNNKENNFSNNNPVTSVSKANIIMNNNNSNNNNNNINSNNDVKSQLDAPKQEPAWKVRLADLRERKQSIEAVSKPDSVGTTKPKVPADKPVFAALKKVQESGNFKGVEEKVDPKTEGRPVFRSLKGEKIDDRSILKNDKNEKEEEKPIFKKSFTSDEDKFKGLKHDDDVDKAAYKPLDEKPVFKSLKEEIEKSPFKTFENEKEDVKPLFKSYKAEREEETSGLKAFKNDKQGETKEPKPEKPDISDSRDKKLQKMSTTSEMPDDNLEFKQIKLNSINKLNHSKTFLHHNNYKNNAFNNKQDENEKGTEPSFSITSKIASFKNASNASPLKQPLKETLSATAKLFPHKDINKDTNKDIPKVFPPKKLTKDTNKDTLKVFPPKEITKDTNKEITKVFPPKEITKDTNKEITKVFPPKEITKDTNKDMKKLFSSKEISKDIEKDTSIQTNKLIKKDKVLPPTNKHIPPPSFKNNF